MTLTPAQEWWTAEQIAESGLPDLPATKRGVNAKAGGRELARRAEEHDLREHRRVPEDQVRQDQLAGRGLFTDAGRDGAHAGGRIAASTPTPNGAR
ncbi:MAG: hypothetical protein HC783_13330 [Rhodobacteraceae bacterium]|nr:hypothetical protein [Paracoccaceae bacterium]